MSEKYKYKKVIRTVRLARRDVDGHKGAYGHVLVVGGSRGMMGAAALASNAALRGGAGLVTVAAPEPIQLAIASLCPCATSIPLAVSGEGEIAPAAVRQMLEAAGRCNVLAVGPGLAVGSGQRALVRAALEQTRPVVLDADGLNNLSAIDGWTGVRNCPLVLTPHPGEFARLSGRAVKEIQSARIESALAAARQWGSGKTGTGSSESLPLVVVLKGAGTVVTDGQRVYVNTTGNPGMATGGTGDVLTGLTAALVAQGLAPFDAACLAVRCHGRAGDLAAKTLGQVSLIASDLLDYLPAAIGEQVEK